MNIYLGDLVHDWEKVSVWCIPLNVGLVGAYARQRFQGDVQVRLFKHPEELIQAIEADPPDILGLSYYAWNANLDDLVFKIVKEKNPRILTVGGGPTFTGLNSDESGARSFFEQHPLCDAFVVGQGERGFAELVRQFLDGGGDPGKLLKAPVEGCMTHEGDLVRVGPLLPPQTGLDEIPSPYLTGLLDPFLERQFVPLLETTRNCPYQCAYCAFGADEGKLQKFGIERILAEIDYVARKTKSDYMIMTDTNFGILPRDAEIAARIHDQHLRCGFPGHLCVTWNKTRADRVLETARQFKGLAMVGASMQSMDNEVLSAIKRRNLPLDEVVKIKNGLQGEKTKLFSELISGLPRQTLESHLADNRRLMDLDAEVFNYGLRFLPGTEIDSEEFREKYYRKTGWRLQNDAFGVYRGTLVLEGEELALETSSMSQEEITTLRFIHLFLQFLWGKGAMVDFLQFFRVLGLHPMDTVLKIVAAFRNAGTPAAIRDIRMRFEEDYALEQFPTYESMYDHWQKPEALERLRRGEYGKLNSHYIFEFLSCYDQLVAFLDEWSREIIDETISREKVAGEACPERLKTRCGEILRFCRERLVDDLFQGGPLRETKHVVFDFDILGWKESGHDLHFLRRPDGERSIIQFHLSPRQARGLEKQIRFFVCDDRKRTLRKMFDVNPYDFFYESRPLPVAAEQAAAHRSGKLASIIKSP